MVAKNSSRFHKFLTRISVLLRLRRDFVMKKLVTKQGINILAAL